MINKQGEKINEQGVQISEILSLLKAREDRGAGQRTIEFYQVNIELFI